LYKSKQNNIVKNRGVAQKTGALLSLYIGVTQKWRNRHTH